LIPASSTPVKPRPTSSLPATSSSCPQSSDFGLSDVVEVYCTQARGSLGERAQAARFPGMRRVEPPVLRAPAPYDRQRRVNISRSRLVRFGRVATCVLLTYLWRTIMATTTTIRCLRVAAVAIPFALGGCGMFGSSTGSPTNGGATQGTGAGGATGAGASSAAGASGGPGAGGTGGAAGGGAGTK
jgi:hypothetical protein